MFTKVKLGKADKVEPVEIAAGCFTGFRVTILKDVISVDAILKNAIPKTKSLYNTESDKNNRKYTNPDPNLSPNPNANHIPVPNLSPDPESHLIELSFSE